MTTMSATMSADDVRVGLAILSRRVEVLERILGQDADTLSEPSELAVIEDVRRITQELFPGKCEFTSEFDPEFPSDRYVVVNVEASGDLKEIAERGCIWDERIRGLSENLFGVVRLSIIPR
jgi:hypothetical protein